MAPDALVPPTAVSGRSPRRVGAPRLLGEFGERRRLRPYEAIGAERERLWQRAPR